MQSKGLSRVFSNTTVQKHHSLALSFLNTPTLISIHDYWKNQSFGCMDLCWLSVVPLLFNTVSRFVIAFLPGSKCLFISWLQSPSAVILQPQKMKSVTVSIIPPSICHEVMGPDAVIPYHQVGKTTAQQGSAPGTKPQWRV